jgi:hypothetical protein
VSASTVVTNVIGITDAKDFTLATLTAAAATAFAVTVVLIGVMGSKVKSTVSSDDIVGSSPWIVVEGNVMQIKILSRIAGQIVESSTEVGLAEVNSDGCGTVVIFPKDKTVTVVIIVVPNPMVTESISHKHSVVFEISILEDEHIQKSLPFSV